MYKYSITQKNHGLFLKLHRHHLHSVCCQIATQLLKDEVPSSHIFRTLDSYFSFDNIFKVVLLILLLVLQFNFIFQFLSTQWSHCTYHKMLSFVTDNYEVYISV